MKTLLLIVTVLFALSPLALADQPTKGEVRDSSGQPLFKTYTRGWMTETREPQGKLVTKSTTKYGNTDVRASMGVNSTA